MDMRSKMRGLYLGFVVGEFSSYGHGESRLGDLLCGTHPVVECGGDFHSFLAGSLRYLGEWSAMSAPEAVPGMARYLPTGAFFHDDLLNSMSWARESCSLVSENPMVHASASAISLMAMLAMVDVPVGLWMNELSVPLGGVGVPSGSPIGSRDILVESLDLANRMAAGIAPEGAYLGDGNLPHEVVGWSMFCVAAAPRDFYKAVLLAGNTPSPVEVSGIVGALMGAMLGEDVVSIPVSPIPTSELVLDIADEMFSVKQGLAARE